MVAIEVGAKFEWAWGCHTREGTSQGKAHYTKTGNLHIDTNPGFSAGAKTASYTPIAPPLYLPSFWGCARV